MAVPPGIWLNVLLLWKLWLVFLCVHAFCVCVCCVCVTSNDCISSCGPIDPWDKVLENKVIVTGTAIDR